MKDGSIDYKLNPFGYEIYKNDVLIDMLDHHHCCDSWTSSVKNKEGKILILQEDYEDGGFKLYYGVKKRGIVGEGPDGETTGNIYCRTFRKINW